MSVKRKANEIEDEEKLEIIDGLLQDFAHARAYPPPPELELEYRTHAVLKAIALDLRGMIGTAPSEVYAELHRKVRIAMKSKTATGYTPGALITLAETLIGKWATVRQAILQTQELRARADLYEMMAHDVASPQIINAIFEKYPQIAKRWESQ